MLRFLLRPLGKAEKEVRDTLSEVARRLQVARSGAGLPLQLPIWFKTHSPGILGRHVPFQFAGNRLCQAAVLDQDTHLCIDMQ